MAATYAGLGDSQVKPNCESWFPASSLKPLDILNILIHLINIYLAPTIYEVSNEHSTVNRVMNKSAIPFLMDLKNKNLIMCFHKHL